MEGHGVFQILLESGQTGALPLALEDLRYGDARDSSVASGHLGVLYM